MNLVHLANFNRLNLLGTGGAGQVYLVEYHDVKYAMKMIHTNSKRNLENAIRERDILLKLHHPFFPILYYSFQDDYYLYLIMSYCECGNFYHFMKKQVNQCFTKQQTTYYASCLLVALEYLHFNGIIHRDLKPDNVLLSSDGHILLTDFNLSAIDQVHLKTFKLDDIHVVAEPNMIMHDQVGSRDYLAPEIVEHRPYTCMVDWWSYGIMIYEMLYGFTPFKNYQSIHECHLLFPCTKSHKCKNLIKSLLQHDPHQRLGFTGGAAEIKSHSFFHHVPFQLLNHQNPPIIPF